MYSDPAVNLFLGNGFTSSAWYAQPYGEFWAGNVPLHSALLFLWIKMFGFSIIAIRSINYIYMVAASLLLWRASIRLNLITSSRLRLLLLALLASGYSMIFAYRSGRPDCLTLLLICAAIYTFSLNSPRQKIFGLFALGCLMPWAGLQLLPLLAVGGVLLLLYIGRTIFPALLATAIGVAFGGLSLLWFYISHGVWPRFLASVRQHTTIGFFGWLAHGEIRHSNLVPKDFSFMVLFILALILAAKYLRKPNLKSPLSFGLAYSIALTIALIASGKFPTYYGWMTYLPLCLCLCMTLDRHPPTGIFRPLSAIFLSTSILLSLALHSITAADDWNDRDYSKVENFIHENVSPTDWLYGDFSTYYAAKKTAARSFMPLYLPAFRDSEKQNLTVLVIAPQYFASVTNAIGGDWISTGKQLIPERNGFWASRRNMGFLSTQNYALEVFRRAAPEK